MPLVVDARVIGLPDARRGQQIAACVVRRDGSLGVVALRTSAPSGSPPTRFRAPRLLDEMPRDDRGKVSRQALEAS